MSKARAVYVGLKYLWRWRTISLKLQDRVCIGMLIFVVEIFYTEDIAGVGWNDRASNANAGNPVLGISSDNTLSQRIQFGGLFGHVLCVSNTFTVSCSVFRPSNLSGVRAARVQGWKMISAIWLDTLKDMSANRKHWRPCRAKVLESVFMHPDYSFRVFVVTTFFSFSTFVGPLPDCLVYSLILLKRGEKCNN